MHVNWLQVLSFSNEINWIHISGCSFLFKVCHKDSVHNSNQNKSKLLFKNYSQWKSTISSRKQRPSTVVWAPACRARDLSLITGSNALLVDERSPLWCSACEKWAVLQLWGAQPLWATCLEAALVRAEAGSPNPPTGVWAAVDAYAERSRGVVLLWKFGEVFSPGGKHINIFSCDMCQNLLPIGASEVRRITCIDFGVRCIVSIWVRKSHISGYIFLFVNHLLSLI